MEPEKRTPREITYHVGWKRGKIVSAPDARERPQTGEYRHKATSSVKLLAAAVRSNERTFWQTAPLPSARLLQAAVVALPAVVFIFFVWMVYWLSRFS